MSNQFENKKSKLKETVNICLDLIQTNFLLFNILLLFLGNFCGSLGYFLFQHPVTLVSTYLELFNSNIVMQMFFCFLPVCLEKIC